MNEELPLVFSYAGCPWSLAKARKETECWLCSAKLYPGDQIYRPITNSDFRMRRICTTCGGKLGKPE